MLNANTLINGRYRIERTLGVGGMGSVYAAHDERLGRRVALKLLRSDLAADTKSRDRFLAEAQIAAQLVHPHIVRTYDVGDAPEGPYLVQELLAGQTLDTHIPLPPQEAIAVARGVAEALSYIHGQGYVHCDIKPQNIMLQGDPATPHAVLLDFGIARVEGTATTTLIATPHYLAPERATGAAPTASSDLYALGIVLFHTLAGNPPFDAPTIHAIIEQHRTARLPPLPIAGPQKPDLEAIIRRLVAKQPHERYASAAALLADLSAVGNGAAHAQPTVAVGSVAAPVASPKQRAAVPPPIAARVATTAHKKLGLRWLALPIVFAAVLLLGSALVRDRPTNAIVPQPGASGEAIPSAGPTIDTAPALVTLPPVIGLPAAEAQVQIEAAGLQFQTGAVVQSDQPAGVVLATEPPGDQPIVAGTTIIAQISAGSPPAAPVSDDDDDDDDDDGEQERGKGKDNGKGKGKNKDD
jgi:eukaryotic-like serine/threonine-protein kinase